MGIRRTGLATLALALVLALLTACGGGDDDGGGGGNGDVPTPSGAEQIGEEEASAEDIDAEEVEMSDAKVAAYKVTDGSFDDVADFYENDVTDDGWAVEEHVAFGELMLAVLVSENDVAIVTAMSAEAAREQGATDIGDLEINLDELADDDILIVAASFTCEEESVDACIEAMNLGI